MKHTIYTLVRTDRLGFSDIMYSGPDKLTAMEIRQNVDMFNDILHDENNSNVKYTLIESQFPSWN
jgi:hypothetical protein